MHLALNFQRIEPARGGAETYVADLCRILVEAGHRVDVYAESAADGSLPGQANLVQIAVEGKSKLARIMSFARNSEAALRAAQHDCSVGFINTWAHDVIIPQGGVRYGSLTANAQRFRTPLRQLYLLAKTANPKHWIYESIEARQYDAERRARVVAVSGMVARHVEEIHHVPRQQIRVVPNAIDPKRVLVSQPGAARCAFRNRHGLEPGDLVGLFAGHNFALKGLKPLLQALGARARLRSNTRPIHLLVCGSGEQGAYRRLANRLGLGEKVHFLGFHPEVEACYWSSDFFVQPTYYDPCSLVVLEALVCGLPVITTAQNGASELLVDGREGYVLTAPDARGELIAALDHMTDDAARRQMSDNAARLGKAQSFDEHVAALLAIFEEVAAAKRWRVPLTSKKRTRAAAPHFDRTKKARREETRGATRHRGQEGSSMQAILLAGGKGARLRPYTHVLPKPLMPLGDDDPMPIIEVVLRQLGRFGFRDVTIITGYLTELIEAFCGDGTRFGTHLSYRREPTPLGTAGGLALIDRPSEPVLVINGDILTTLNYAEMHSFHCRRRAMATIASYPREVKIDFGVLHFDSDPHILTGYQEKPEYSFEVSMGVYILDPLAWNYLRPGEPMPMPDLLESMRHRGHDIHCYRQECYWLDIGRHDDYATANEIFEARRGAFLGGAASRRVWIGRDQ